MRELRILMHRYRQGAVKLVPLLYFEVFEDFERCVQQCPVDLWREDLQQIRIVTMIRKEKVCALMIGYTACVQQVQPTGAVCRSTTLSLYKRLWIT